MTANSSSSYYFRHSTTPWVEKLRFALRQAYFERGQVSPLWQLLSQSSRTVAPQLICKTMEAPQRLFYDWRYGYAQRVQALCDHYTFVMSCMPAAAAAQVLRLQSCGLFTFEGKSGQHYQLLMGVDHQMEKEGALTLDLRSQGLSVTRCTLHFARLPSSDWIIRIGGLQSTNIDTQQQIKQATRDFHGIQPRILMLQAVRALAQALGVQRIEAVGGSWHIYSSKRYRKTIGSDYDQLWAFLGMQALPDGHFATDTQMPIKDLQDCPSHKRSEYRRRNECLLSLQEQIVQALK